MTQANAGARYRASEVAVVASSIHVPGAWLDGLLGTVAAPACPPERAHELLGSRGLLNKEPATRLALCAVHRALGLPPRAPRGQGPPDPRVAVVASSNFGNVATVQGIVRTLRTAGLKDVSALDAPNASSNILASTVAIWFRFGGPNLMVCAGATSGLDAVYLGATLLRADRADRVVVVGAEPDDPSARALHAGRAAATRGARLCGGAAAIVLERVDTAPTDAPVIGPVRAAAHLADLYGEDPEAIMLGPAEQAPRTRAIDLQQELGDSYGALGVLQIAMAVALISAGPRGRQRCVKVVCGDGVDGWRSTLVQEPAARRGAEAASVEGQPV